MNYRCSCMLLVLAFVVVATSPTPTCAQTLSDVNAASLVPSPTVVGYWGANANTPPLNKVPATYNVIIYAFASINAPNNTLDPVSGGFYLTSPPSDLRAQIQQIKKLRPHQRVLFSIGGEDDAIESTSVPFTAKALLSTLSYWGFDGVDLDLETVTDLSRIQQIADMIAGAKRSRSDMIVSMAPQTAFAPGANGTAAGLAPSFIYSPLLKALGAASKGESLVDLINIQFYNNWPCAATPAACVSASNMALWVTGLCNAYPGIKPANFIAGFPASRSAATSGYQTPATIEKFVKTVVAPGTIGGVMTWSVEWDHTTGYAWSKAVAAGLAGA